MSEEGGILERLTADGSVIDKLTQPGGVLDKVAEPGGIIDRLADDDGLLDQLPRRPGRRRTRHRAGRPVDRVAELTENMNELTPSLMAMQRRSATCAPPWNSSTPRSHRWAGWLSACQAAHPRSAGPRAIASARTGR